jgi:hypothetical protein
MTPYKQLFRHCPDEGIWGDCYRSAIASVLDLHPSDVPHVMDKGATSDTADAKMAVWLASRGLCIIQIAWGGGDMQAALTTQKYINPDRYYLLSGKSRTGCNHVVVCLNDGIVHDPSLDDAGIIGPCIEDGYFWLEFFGAAVGKAA